MGRRAKLTAAVTAASVLVVAGLVALTVPSVAAAHAALSSWPVFNPQSADEVVVPDEVMAEADEAGLIYAGNGTWFSPEGPGDCESNAAIHPYGAGDPSAKLSGDLVDMGEREFAAGPVGYNADGLIETYTVQSGDALMAIGERFCVDYVTVGAYNDRFGPLQIQPGDVLILRP